MAEIEITLPTVQYGNVKVRATPEELGLKSLAEAYDVGVASAVYLNVFTQGFQKGATLDVSAPQGASQSEVDQVIDETLKNAQRLVEDGLGGVTEVRSVEQIMSDEDVDTIEQARKIQESEVKAPWNSTVDAKPKPWEADDVTAPVVLDASW